MKAISKTEESKRQIKAKLNEQNNDALIKLAQKVGKANNTMGLFVLATIHDILESRGMSLIEIRDAIRA